MTEFEELQLAEYSDEDLLRYINSAESLIDSSLPGADRVKVLSPNLVVKVLTNITDTDELAGMALGESLGIRVPAIRRVVQHDQKHYVVTLKKRIAGIFPSVIRGIYPLNTVDLRFGGFWRILEDFGGFWRIQNPLKIP